MECPKERMLWASRPQYPALQDSFGTSKFIELFLRRSKSIHRAPYINEKNKKSQYLRDGSSYLHQINRCMSWQYSKPVHIVLKHIPTPKK